MTGLRFPSGAGRSAAASGTQRGRAAIPGCWGSCSWPGEFVTHSAWLIAVSWLNG
jgi:hypothetical protein